MVRNIFQNYCITSEIKIFIFGKKSIQEEDTHLPANRVDPRVGRKIGRAESLPELLPPCEMRHHVIRPRYQYTYNDEISGGYDSEGDHGVAVFRLHEDEAGEPHGPGDQQADGRAEETLALPVIARQLEDEEAHDEQRDQQEYIVSWKQVTFSCCRVFFILFRGGYVKQKNLFTQKSDEYQAPHNYGRVVVAEDEEHDGYGDLDEEHEEHHQPLEVAVYVGGEHAPLGEHEEEGPGQHEGEVESEGQGRREYLPRVQAFAPQIVVVDAERKHGLEGEHVGEYQDDRQHWIPVEDVLDHETVDDEDGDRAAGERPAHDHRQEDWDPVASL